jgi:hypothetical protein
MTIKIGQRVRAHSSEDIGSSFRGQLGTVTEVDGTYLHVDFDFVGKPGHYLANGGGWDVEAVDFIDEADLLAEIDRLTAGLEVAEKGAEALADEAEYLRKTYRYARSLLPKHGRGKVDGYLDALLGGSR